MTAETKTGGWLTRTWRGLKALFGRTPLEEISPERQAALQAKHAAEARRDDHMATVRTYEPPMI